MVKVSPLYKHPFLFRLAGIPRLGKQKLRSEIGRIIGKNKSVFDVACGFGSIQKSLHPSCSYRGIDLNDTFIRYGRERYDRDIQIQDGVDGLDYPRSDVVIITDLLHHLSTEKTKMVLTKSLRAAPMVIIVEPSYLGLAKQKNIVGRIINWFFTAIDQDGINLGKTWRSEAEYRKEFENFFGLRIENVKVRVLKIGLSLLAAYEAEKAPQ